MKSALLLLALAVSPVLNAQSEAVPPEPVQLDRSGVTLYGSLRLPADATDLLILHAGSGPTDRNGNQAAASNDSLKLLAEGLSAAGIAVLTYDKRGSGETGMVGAEIDLRPSTYIDDFADWIDWARAEHPALAIHLLGHSEGALFALAAAQDQAVASVISLAGAGRPAGALLREQTRGRLGPLAEEFEATLSQLEAGQTVDEVNPMLNTLFRPSVQPYLVEWLAMDPVALAAGLAPPLLVVAGSSDLQVVEADYEALGEVAEASAWIEGMNHVLKAVDGPLAAQLPSYTDPSLPLHPELLPVLIDWVER
jgi:pimeloyl-ACP methyl ester carboxylesterase